MNEAFSSTWVKYRVFEQTIIFKSFILDLHSKNELFIPCELHENLEFNQNRFMHCS